ncbi:copper amine oxidase N-terminal domain-containing protein [bacterium]|nr:copper amine oxidase N-terminal domain-containing protein [bacterium]
MEEPENNSTTNNDVIDIKGLVIDEESGIKSLKINGENVTFSDKGIFEKKGIILKDNLNKFEIKATNNASLSTTEILTITKALPPDETPPKISIIQPNNKSVVETSNILVSFMVEDKESGILKVLVNKKELSSPGKGQYASTIDLVKGENQIIIIAIDKAGNLAKEVLTVTYQTEKPTVIKIMVGNKIVIVNGKSNMIEAPPFIHQATGRTLIPIRIIVESIGGSVGYESKERKVTLIKQPIIMELWIDNPIAFINGVNIPIDKNNSLAPLVVNGRTFLPLRFVAESFNGKVDWDAPTQTITLTFGSV